ncbi:MAG: transcriptional regulator [bacterium]|nr:MAG: transcriptional regulator [bacterium]
MTVTIKPIKSEKDHQITMNRVDELVLKLNRSEEEEDELEVLSELVWAYEQEHYPMDPPSDPIGALQFVMEQKNLKQKDLIPYIGHESHVSEILTGKRQLTVEMIKKLHHGLNIPYECLMGD